MFFLIKCVICLAILFMVLPWRETAAPHANAIGHAHEKALRGHKAAAASARGDDVLSSLSRQAAAKLAEAAREHCLIDPRDCLSALGAVAPPASKQEPRRR